MKLTAALARRMRLLAGEVAKFGAVGAIAFVVDLGGFSLLRYGFDHHGPLEHKPLTARTISVVVATVVAYFGNRHWTWRDRERRALHHEYALFFVLNFAALVLNLAILAFVNYILDLHDPVSNVIANLVGIGLGTLMRFWSYRRFVFRTPAAVKEEDGSEPRVSSPA